MSILGGGGLIAGVHLILCTWFNDQIAHLVHESGKEISGVHVQLDGLHVIDVFVGGVAVVWVSIADLWSLWRAPSHG